MAIHKYHIFDQMIEGIQIINPRWQYVYVNDAVAKQGKFHREELLGHTMMEKYPGIEKTEMFAFLQKCMLERTVHQMVNEFDFSDGSKGYFEIRMQPVDEGVLILSFDITEQKLAEKALQTNLDRNIKLRTSELSSKRKEFAQFAHVATHDLQEPVRTISNYIEVLEEEYSEQLDDTAEKYLEAMGRATMRMSLLAKSLLDYSLLGLTGSPVYFEVGTVVRQVLYDLDPKIQECGAVIRVGNMPALHAYETELYQLFYSLLSNALKFAKKDRIPEIEVSSEQVGHEWQFSVSDNGIGIAHQHYERIFQIFQRLHLPEEFEGCGIGLAHCKKIVELHQGEIHVASILGQGSIFTFTLTNQLLHV